MIDTPVLMSYKVGKFKNVLTVGAYFFIKDKVIVGIKKETNTFNFLMYIDNFTLSYVNNLEDIKRCGHISSKNFDKTNIIELISKGKYVYPKNSECVVFCEKAYPIYALGYENYGIIIANKEKEIGNIKTTFVEKYPNKWCKIKWLK